MRRPRSLRLLAALISLTGATAASGGDCEPSLAGEYVSPIGGVFDVRARDSLAYVIGGLGLTALDVSDPGDVTPVGSANVNPLNARLDVEGNRVYVLNGLGNLVVFDVTTPAFPVELGRLTLPGGPAGIRASGGRVYALNADPSELFVIDASNGTFPIVLGSLPLMSGARGLGVRGNVAFIGHADGLLAVDLDDPAFPVIADTLAISGVVGVEVRGELAYVASGDSLAVVDISDPAELSALGAVGVTGVVLDLAVHANRAYLARFDNLLEVFDVSLAEAPTRIGSSQVLGALAVDADAELVYVGSLFNTFTVLDPSPCGSSIADLDGDGSVSAADLAVLLAAWGQPSGAADLDEDGAVGSGDLAILLAAWGEAVAP